MVDLEPLVCKAPKLNEKKDDVTDNPNDELEGSYTVWCIVVAVVVAFIIAYTVLSSEKI